MENKPICEIDSMGTKRWYLNGCLHREDGPAVEMADGTKCWYLNGNYHRLDGPAIVDMRDSENYGLWYINGNDITRKIIQWAKEHDIDLENLTDVDKALIKITWADYGK